MKSLTIIWMLSLSMATAFSPIFRGNGRLFLDTADVREWDQFLPTGIFHGVTTNPTLLERAREPCTISNIHNLAGRALAYDEVNEFMCQAWGETPRDLVECGVALTDPDRERIVVKVPVTPVGVEAASRLVSMGRRVCLTACYSSKQAVLAAGVGAEYLAPYLGRMTDARRNGFEECRQMQQITKGLKSDTRILVASIRDVNELVNLAASGMETFTFSPTIARELFRDPLTDTAARDFEIAAVQNGDSRRGGDYRDEGPPLTTAADPSTPARPRNDREDFSRRGGDNSRSNQFVPGANSPGMRNDNGGYNSGPPRNNNGPPRNNNGPPPPGRGNNGPPRRRAPSRQDEFAPRTGPSSSRDDFTPNTGPSSDFVTGTHRDGRLGRESFDPQTGPFEQRTSGNPATVNTNGGRDFPGRPRNADKYGPPPMGDNRQDNVIKNNNQYGPPPMGGNRNEVPRNNNYGQPGADDQSFSFQAGRYSQENHGPGMEQFRNGK